MTQKQYNERYEWFLNRIGNTVFGAFDSCGCRTCEIWRKEGFVIKTKDNADECLMAEVTTEEEVNSGTHPSSKPIRYFDTKEERDDYENQYK